MAQAATVRESCLSSVVLIEADFSKYLDIKTIMNPIKTMDCFRDKKVNGTVFLTQYRTVLALTATLQ